MKFPVAWLKEYLNFSASPERLAELLTMSGTKVEHVEKKNGEPVLEIEITTNRPDCLSILGLAREAAVLTGQKIKPPKISKSLPAGRQASRGGKRPKIQVLDKKGCPLYTARLIENVSIKPASAKIQKFLELMGSRPINNAVDATNYVLFETGQPLHAFDYDKIKGGAVIVRKAKKGEKFLGIDGIQYTLDEKTLVIADAEKAIAIAGVIGGKLTEVTSSTKNILLESAYFDPLMVRQASRFYKISTESSYRFERGVDIENVNLASARAKDLILEWGGGSETGADFVQAQAAKKSPAIRLRTNRVENLLGVSLKPARVTSILTALGFKTKAAGKGDFTVIPPSSRRDVTQEADLAEELLRIEGFEKIPAVIPSTRYAKQVPVGDRAVRLLELKKFVSGLGFNEIITYSFLSEKALKDSSLPVESPKAHKVVNALSGELQYFRPSLLPGMLQSVLFNVHRKASSLKLFEIGNRCANGREECALSLCLYGPWEENWLRKSPASLFDLKGAAERIFEHFRFRGYEWKENAPCPKYAASASVYAGSQKLGTLSVLSASVQRSWDIPHEVMYLEIALDSLLDIPVKNETRVQAVPKFPAVRRDVAFVIDQSVSVKSLETLLANAGGPYLKEVKLFDQYTGKNISSGRRSLAFSLSYQKDSGTFTDEEINALQNKIGDALKREYKVEFR